MAKPVRIMTATMAALSAAFLAALAAAVAAALPLLAAADAAEARTVTDAAGRAVEVPDEVGRIVALGTSMAFVTWLGAQDLAVAVESVDKHQTVVKPYVAVNGDRFKDLPAVDSGGSARIRNHEEIILAKPDVVLLVAASPTEAADLQAKIRIPVVSLSAGTPYFEPSALKASITLAGEVLGRAGRAAEINSGLSAMEDRLRPPPEGRRARAYVGGMSSRGNRDLTSTTTDSWPMTAAGIDNAMEDSGRRGQLFVNKEHLMLLNPPLIFLDCNGMVLIREDAAKSPRYYEGLSAFRSGGVWQVLPHNSYMANVEINYVNALLMAKAAYPDLYRDLDPAAAVDEVFGVFFGRPLYARYVEGGCGFGQVELREGGVLELVGR